MATYYCRAGFSDSNNGLTPATAVGTLNKLIGTTGIMASGDQAYIGGGVYRLTAAQPLTLAPTAETKLIGDPAGQFTGDAGEVIITGYGTNDTTAPFSGNLFSFAAARNFYTWENITFQAPAGVIFPFAASKNWTFTDCTFYPRLAGGSSMFTFTTIAGVATAFTYNRCRFFQTSASSIWTVISTLHTADYDIQFLVKSCYFHYRLGTVYIMTTTASAGAGIPFGFSFLENHFDGTAKVIDVSSAAHSIAGGASQSTFKRNMVDIGNGTAISAGNTTQIVSDWNRYPGGATNTNVTAGANDNATNAPSWRPDLGQLAIFGYPLRPWMTPGKDDPHNILVTDASGLTTDLLNRPLPAGGASTNTPVGPLGRHDTAVPGSVLSGDSGGWSEIIGPGDQQYRLWVGPTATTVSVKVKWDATYGNTAKPQLQIVANARIGVAAQTITATGTAGSAYESLSATFTPTAAGEVRLRIVSRSAAGNGVLAYDTFAIS